ncbi:MAG: hypothetical protein IJB67_02240 [Firmicutes bacterium]|nr:hypothetical protein [Bacillota bacterium]
MFHLIGLASLAFLGYQCVKEACEPEIPAENWANKDLYYQDIMDGVPVEQRMKNLRAGKYKLTETYPEPHRTPSGQILIENSKLYYEDVKNYGAHQAQKWVEQGKYNLTPEELEKEMARIEEKW